MTRKISKVLVANRGEIAVRIFKTLHQMGIGSVAIYSDADAGALHMRLARESLRLEGRGLGETYLNIPEIVRLAVQSGADAVHPGYGFLSESAAFSSAVREAGILFIGPGDEAIRLMGNKVEARLRVEKMGIPVIKGLTGTTDALLDSAANTGFPLLVKAAAGGGGKGMRIVWNSSELVDALESAQREAVSYFGNGEVYLEKYLINPRHIEVQLMADHHGQVVCLFERECSVQRRYQKIIEEAPGPAVTDGLREKLMEAARHIAHDIAYVNAGTIEFLVDGEDFYFLEMNTRIQVEHPVTEMITGVDIVKEQLRIASGLPLSFDQNSVQIHGHSIEARVYAEDPSKDFMPSPGNLVFYQEPVAPDIRIDSAMNQTGTVNSEFDPMISKVIAYARTRDAARKKLIGALGNYAIHGVRTNIPFLTDLLNSDEFTRGDTDTGFCSRFIGDGFSFQPPEESELEVIAAAFLFVGSRCKPDSCRPLQQFAGGGNCPPPGTGIWSEAGYWRVSMAPEILIDQLAYRVRVIYKGNGTLVLGNRDLPRQFQLKEIHNNELTFGSDNRYYKVFFSFDQDGRAWIQTTGRVSLVSFAVQLNEDEVNSKSHNTGIEGQENIKAPMHGKVVKILVQEQDVVNKGDALLILESMKIENKILAPGKARVSKIHVTAGDMVAGETSLFVLTEEL